MNKNPNQNQKLNGAQRVELLEQLIAKMSQDHEKQMVSVANEINRLNELVVALAKRMNAIVKAGESQTGINSESVKEVMQNEEAKNLAAKVQMLVDQGVMVRNDQLVIEENTFVVGREEDSEGKEVNPRSQFLVRALHPDAIKQIVGKKVGDTVVNTENQQVFFITETYQIQQIPGVTADASAEETETNPAPEAEAPGAEVIRTRTKTRKQQA